MGFKLLILDSANPEARRSYDWWPERLKQAVPGIEVHVCHSVGEAMGVIAEVDAAFGNIAPEIFARAEKLRWIASPLANPTAGYFHRALIDSDVVVTNTRGIYDDHISAHIMSFVLAFARGLHVYVPHQLQRQWMDPRYQTIHLPESTAVIVGVGGVGAETARLCSEFGMTVIGVDPRTPEPPPGVAELHRPEALDDVLPRGDFVIITVPQTPETQGMFARGQFRLMKRGAFLINIGRGSTVKLDDLVAALQAGELAGAGLDVFETEPLPEGHPLWTMPGILITPHVALTGPYLDDRRTELFVENCVRFDKGMPLQNVVDKARWF